MLDLPLKQINLLSKLLLKKKITVEINSLNSSLEEKNQKEKRLKELKENLDDLKVKIEVQLALQKIANE